MIVTSTISEKEVFRKDFSKYYETMTIKHANYDRMKEKLYILYSIKSTGYSDEFVDKVYIVDLRSIKSNVGKEFFVKGDIEMSLKYDAKPYLSQLYADMLF